MNNLVYKFYHQFLRTILKNQKAYFKCWFALIGGCCTCCQIEYSLIKTQNLLSFFQSHLLLFFVTTFIISLFLERDKTKFSVHLGDKDTSITLILSDILSIKNTAVVIPTNTTFDTTMNGEFISPKSIQGQFQKKYFHSDFAKLDEQLYNSLDHDYPKSFQLLSNRKNSKQKQYPIGTVAKVEVGNRRFYFLAVADVNERGKPLNVTVENITKALVGLWTYLTQNGHTENIAVPVIGTGRAGLKDGTLEDVVHETIFSFSISAREEFVAKKLFICIFPPSLSDANTSWDDLCDYLKLQCKFANDAYKRQKISKQSGQAVEY